MGLTVKSNEKNIPLLDQGVYTGICVGVVDLGEQRNEAFKKYQDRVLFFFEIVGEFVDVGEGEVKPRWLSKEFTASLNSRSNLLKYLQSWRGKAFTAQETASFDLKQMVGQSCQLQVMIEEGKDERKYNAIQNIMSLPKGTKAGKPISDLVVFDMDDLDAAEKVLPSLPEWVREKIMKSPTWASLHQNTEDLDIDADEVQETAQPAEAGVEF